MRHGKTHNHLSRKVGHRRSLLRNLSISLINHKRISTTLAKAKALRVYVEPIITTAKANTQQAHREAFKNLQNKEAVKELFATVVPAVGERPGGYVRVIRTGTRLGDNAETAIIELVDFNESYDLKEKSASKTRRRRRRGGSSTSASTETGTATVSPVAEALSPAIDAVAIDQEANDTPEVAPYVEPALDPTDEATTSSAIGDALVEEHNDDTADTMADPEVDSVNGDSLPLDESEKPADA